MSRTGPFCCFAQGLGLVALDGAVADAFEDGPGWEHPQGRNHAALEAAMATGRAVMLTTGETGIDYLVQIFEEPAPGEAPEHFVVAVGFQMVVDSGVLVLRDTFNLMDWDGAAVEAIRAQIEPGSYFIELLRLDDPNGLCILHLHLTPCPPPEEPLSGWVDVF